MINLLKKIGVAAWILPWIFGITGCTESQIKDQATRIAHVPYQSENAYRSGELGRIRRIVVLPLVLDSIPESEILAYETVLNSALIELRQFEVVPVSRETLAQAWNQRSFSPSRPLPLHFLDRLQSEYGADAVLFPEVTAYRPYKPIRIGFRYRVTDITTGKTLVAFDDFFDSGVPEVAVAARRFHNRQASQSYPLDSSASVLNSPLRFFNYVSHEAVRHSLF